MKEEKLNDLMDIIDVDWIEDNPDSALELIEWMYKELQHRKDVIQTQREALLLSSSIIQKYKDAEERRRSGWDGEPLSDWT